MPHQTNTQHRKEFPCCFNFTRKVSNKWAGDLHAVMNKASSFCKFLLKFSRPLVEISENVRGKKRKNLPGFTCQKCDAVSVNLLHSLFLRCIDSLLNCLLCLHFQYYKAANLGADGIQKCTRHRGSLYDRPVTPPGWWDPGWSKEHDAE